MLLHKVEYVLLDYDVHLLRSIQFRNRNNIPRSIRPGITKKEILIPIIHTGDYYAVSDVLISIL